MIRGLGGTHATRRLPLNPVAASGHPTLALTFATSFPWRPYAATSLFNTPLSNPTVATNSATLVSQLHADNTNPGFSGNDDYSHPIYFATTTNPVYTINIINTDWGPSSDGMSFRMPTTAVPERGSDGHLCVINADGWEYDFWQASINQSTHVVTASFGGRCRIDGEGNDPGHGLGTALSYGLPAGNITGEELAAGNIRHALFLISRHTNGDRTNGAWTQGSTGGGNYPAMGQRFYYAITDAQIAALAASNWVKAVFTAMAHYGMIVGDTGGGFFKGESPLPYTTVGQTPPLNAVSTSFFTLPIDWSKMRAIAYT